MNQIIEFILAHQVILGMVIIAILDLLFAINKNLESNGALHAVYLFAKGIQKPKNEPS